MKKLDHLQSLRFVAASMVVVDHAIETMVRRGALDTGFLQSAWFCGWAGVTSFFMISGLIMIRTSWTSFAVAGASATFAVRRIIRVVPLYWLATALFALVAASKGQFFTLEQVLKSLLFIPYALPGSVLIRPIAGQGWTLDYEMAFYALFVLCLLLHRRAGVAMLLAVPLLFVVIGTLARPMFPYRDAATPLQFWTDPIMLAFSIGVAIGIFEIRMPTWHRFRHSVAGSLAIYALIYWLCTLIDPGYRLPVYGVGCAVAVLLCTSADTGGNGPLGRLFVRCGDASYSTYLFHPFAIMALSVLWGHSPAALQSPILFIVVGVVAANALGILSYRLLERPIEHRLRVLVESRFSRMPVVR